MNQKLFRKYEREEKRKRGHEERGIGEREVALQCKTKEFHILNWDTGDSRIGVCVNLCKAGFK